MLSEEYRETSPGFSSRIHDPALWRQLKRAHRRNLIVGFVLSLLVFLCMAVYGHSRGNLRMGLLQGGAVFVLYVIVMLIQQAKRRGGGTWDGTVVDKTMREVKIPHGNTWRVSREYTLHVRSDRGRLYRLTALNSDALHGYYRIGDRVRRHPWMQYFEKYDKRGDSAILCNACLAFNSMSRDTCKRCGCPLLK